MDIRETTLTYPSHDGISQIRALLWDADRDADHTTENQRPKAILQIIHGAAEHCERYRDYARFLVGEGFVVCAEDHVGHGQTAASKDQLGHMPLKGGMDALVADVHKLQELVSAQYPDTPYCMLGHSMGSFILRVYLAQHGQELTAAVLSGTNQQPKAISVLGHALAHLIALFRGATYKSSLLHNMGMGAFAKAVPNANTPFDWLTNDPAVVDAYIYDDKCGMPFTAGAYATLTELTSQMVAPACAQAVPKDLPLLFVAGAEDPVGVRGEGVKAAVEQYRKAGIRQVDLHLYEGLRHEVHNEPSRDRVYRDLVDWLKLQL